MAKQPRLFRPKIMYLVILVAQLIALLVLLSPLFSPTVILLFLLLVFSLFLRWRCKLNPITILIDQSLFIIIAIFYPVAILCSFVFCLYLGYQNKVLYSLPLLIFGLFIWDPLVFSIVCIQATLFGIILYYWEYETNSNIEIHNEFRRQIYELEETQNHLLKDYQNIEKIAQLSERQRIAEILHDDLGHELTAADLALKAYQVLSVPQSDKAKTTFLKAKNRLDNALTRLKDSVKNIEPHNEYGLFQITQLCEHFVYRVNFVHTGDVAKITAYMWQLIHSCLKEALTNIIKHANPKQVNVSFDITDYIVRLIIENDGAYSREKSKGHGLRYMRNRIEAVNGSLSIYNQDLFRLIITIPIGR